jgi:hypothetical protein
MIQVPSILHGLSILEYDISRAENGAFLNILDSRIYYEY